MKKKHGGGCPVHETKGRDGKPVALRKKDCPGCLRRDLEAARAVAERLLVFVDQCGAMSHEARKNLVWLDKYTKNADEIGAEARVFLFPTV